MPLVDDPFLDHLDRGAHLRHGVHLAVAGLQAAQDVLAGAGVFDEFDTLGKERGDTHETGEFKRVVSTLLMQIDALPSHGVTVVASNHPELLDRAVWRRSQLRLELPPPSQSMLEEWFRRFQDRLDEPLGWTPRALAMRLKGLSFAEAEQFGEVLRRHVLALPASNLKRIVQTRLDAWQQRFAV